MPLRRLRGDTWWSAGGARAWRLASDEVALTVTELGAHIVDVSVRTRSGEWRRISLDYPVVDAGSVAGYHGATVGRWANRISGSRFTIDGIAHHVEPNEGANQLHGGPGGLHQKLWHGQADLDNGAGQVLLSVTSPDGDQGFPGQLDATARYRLDGRRLTVEYAAVTDRATPVNLTSHIYWNLGDGTLDGHRLAIAADRCVMVDDAKIPVAGPPIDVTGTRFDARSGSDLADVVAGGGFDHCFLPNVGLDEPCVVLDHDSGYRVEVATDQNGVQVYTGTHLPAARTGVAIEPQRIPDAPNRSDLGPAILHPGEQYRSTMRFEFGV